MEDKDKNTICQLIVGKKRDQPDIRYVGCTRAPARTACIASRLTWRSSSTKFEGLDPKRTCLKIDTFDMRQINIDHYKESLARTGVAVA